MGLKKSFSFESYFKKQANLFNYSFDLLVNKCRTNSLNICESQSGNSKLRAKGDVTQLANVITLLKNVFIESHKEIKKMITNYLGKDSLINCQH